MSKKNLEKAIDSFSQHKEVLKECIKEEGGKIIVNWKKIKEKDLEHRGELQDKAWYILNDVGILSEKSKNNYLLISGVSLNPLTGNLYFTDEKDARDYKKAFFGSVQYPIRIFKGID